MSENLDQNEPNVGGQGTRTEQARARTEAIAIAARGGGGNRQARRGGNRGGNRGGGRRRLRRGGGGGHSSNDSVNSSGPPEFKRFRETKVVEEERLAALRRFRCPFQEEDTCRHEAQPERCQFGHVKKEADLVMASNAARNAPAADPWDGGPGPRRRRREPMDRVVPGTVATEDLKKKETEEEKKKKEAEEREANRARNVHEQADLLELPGYLCLYGLMNACRNRQNFFQLRVRSSKEMPKLSKTTSDDVSLPPAISTDSTTEEAISAPTTATTTTTPANSSAVEGSLKTFEASKKTDDKEGDSSHEEQLMETSSSTGDDNAPPPPPPMEPMVIDDHQEPSTSTSASTSKAADASTKTSTDDSTVSEKSTTSSSKFPCCSSGLHLTTEQLLNLADFELVHAADIAAYFGEVAAQAQGQGPNGQGGENLREKECGICFDRVLEKRLPSKRRFGLLNKCAHVFCAGCLEEWRRRSKICPVCRVPSEKYVTTRRWTADEAAKAALFASVRADLGVGGGGGGPRADPRLLEEALHFDFAAVGNLFAFRGGGGGGGARGRRVANEMAQLREEAGRLLNLPNAGGGGAAAAAADNVPLNWDRGLFADVFDGDGLDDEDDIDRIDDSEDSDDDSDDDDDNLVLRLEELVEEGGNDDVHDQLFFHPSGRRLARLNRNFNQAVVEAEAADAAIRAAQAAAQLDQNIPDQNNRNNQARNLPGPNPNAIVATGVDMSSSNSSQSSEEEDDDDDNFGDDFDDDDDYESAHSEEEYDMAAMYDDLEGMFDDYEDVFGPGDGDDGDGEADPNRPTLVELVADAVVMARNGGPEGLDRLRARRGVGGGLGGLGLRNNRRGGHRGGGQGPADNAALDEVVDWTAPVGENVRALLGGRGGQRGRGGHRGQRGGQRGNRARGGARGGGNRRGGGGHRGGRRF